MTTIKDIANLFDTPVEAEHLLKKITLSDGTINWGRQRKQLSPEDLFNDLANRDGSGPYQVRTLTTLVHRQLNPDVKPTELSCSHNYAQSSKRASLDHYDRMDYNKPNRIKATDEWY